jgi:hypothetical protein
LFLLYPTAENQNLQTFFFEIKLINNEHVFCQKVTDYKTIDNTISYMDDSEPSNNSTQTEMFKNKEQIHQRHTLQQRHGIQPVNFPLCVIYVTCHVMNKHSNVVARLNLGGHHDTFNNSSLYIVYAVRIQE